MTSPTERQLRELFAADAAGAPDAGGLAALALHRVRRRGRARATAAAGLVTASVVVGGVAAVWESPDPGARAGWSGVADCAVAVRFERTVFVEIELLPRPVEPVQPLGDAELSSCEDTGPAPRGAYFPDEPTQVAVWAYPGYDPRQVLTIRYDESDVRLLVAEDAPPDLKREITESLLPGADG